TGPRRLLVEKAHQQDRVRRRADGYITRPQTSRTWRTPIPRSHVARPRVGFISAVRTSMIAGACRVMFAVLPRKENLEEKQAIEPMKNRNAEDLAWLNYLAPPPSYSLCVPLASGNTAAGQWAATRRSHR